jgi:hypothetical protein
MTYPLVFRKGSAIFMGLFLLVVAQHAWPQNVKASVKEVKVEAQQLRVTQALPDYTAKTVTITVSGLDDAQRLAPPKVRLAGAPLVVGKSSVNGGAHTGVITANLPSPIPAGSFLLEVAWGRDGLDVVNQTFALALGLAGPPGTYTEGKPYVWVCTPAFYPMSAGSPRADLYVFNGSSTTANVAVHPLDKNGANLAGVTIPGSSPASAYPGQSGATTVPVLSAHTLILTWVLPQDSPPGGPNVSATVTVSSDQPIVVGSDFQFSGFIPRPCSLLPK